MKKRIIPLLLCLAIVVAVFSGCTSEGKKKRVVLTEQQRTQIKTLVMHREEWKETSAEVSVYPVNAIHVSEIKDGVTFLTVAYVMDGTGASSGTTIFVGVKGFAASGDVFVGTERYHEDWLANYVSVDLDSLSDQELEKVLEQSYIDYLSK